MTTRELTQKIAPACDVFENADEYFVRADMPGVRAEDLKIEFHNGELTLSAPKSGAGVELFSGEETTYEFARRFKVPGGVDTQKIQAELKHGVLQLHIPKEAVKKPVQIPVNVA